MTYRALNKICPRCEGTCASESSFDMRTGLPLDMIYCLNCGYRADPTIELNKTLPQAPGAKSDKYFNKRIFSHAVQSVKVKK